MGWVLPVSHQSSARLISLKGQPYGTLKPAFLVSKDLRFSAEMFEVIAGDRAQPTQGLSGVSAKAWVPSSSCVVAHSSAPCAGEAKAGGEKFKVIFVWLSPEF